MILVNDTESTSSRHFAYMLAMRSVLAHQKGTWLHRYGLEGRYLMQRAGFISSSRKLPVAVSKVSIPLRAIGSAAHVWYSDLDAFGRKLLERTELKTMN